MSAKTDFIIQQMLKVIAAIPPKRGPSLGDEHVIAEWSRQLVLAELEEWERIGRHQVK